MTCPFADSLLNQRFEPDMCSRDSWFSASNGDVGKGLLPPGVYMHIVSLVPSNCATVAALTRLAIV